MEALDQTACFMADDDDIFNFTLDVEEDDDDEKITAVATKAPSTSSLETSNPFSLDPDGDDQSRSFPEFIEEELEWLSNKDAFPALETCLDILSDNPGIAPSEHQSPVSVLESVATTITTSSNGSSALTSCCGALQVPACFPVRARSKRRRRRRRGGFPEMSGQQWLQVNIKNSKQQPKLPPLTPASTKIGRKCQHCGAEKTPQWRAGPMGPKTLCNACGVRYKSGRLVPEYRPASSPTFSSELHSNSHRKILDMRKKQQEAMPKIVMNRTSCGYGVG